MCKWILFGVLWRVIRYIEPWNQLCGWDILPSTKYSSLLNFLPGWLTVRSWYWPKASPSSFNKCLHMYIWLLYFEVKICRSQMAEFLTFTINYKFQISPLCLSFSMYLCDVWFVPMHLFTKFDGRERILLKCAYTICLVRVLRPWCRQKYRRVKSAALCSNAARAIVKFNT